MNETQQEIESKREVMLAYGQMMDTWAWKDFSNFLERTRAATIRDFVTFTERDAVEFQIGEYKGILQCLNKIDHFLKNATQRP